MSDEIYIPGEWKCPMCSFVMFHSVINAETGQIGHETVPAAKPCPNGCGEMDRVKWKDACKEAREHVCKFAEENMALKKRLAVYEN